MDEGATIPPALMLGGSGRRTVTERVGREPVDRDAHVLRAKSAAHGAAHGAACLAAHGAAHGAARQAAHLAAAHGAARQAAHLAAAHLAAAHRAAERAQMLLHLL